MTDDSINLHDIEGWKGDTIPLELQSLILMRKFRSAVHICYNNLARLHRDIEGLLGEADAQDIPNLLQQHPFFMRVLNKMVESHDEFGDKSFRKTSGELFHETADELEDMIVWMAMGLWVVDGAEFPEGVFAAYAEKPLAWPEREYALDEEE